MKLFATYILASLLLVAAAEAKELPEVTTIVAVKDLTPEMTQEIMRGVYPDITLAFEQGTSLPLQLLFRTKFFSMQYNPDLTFTVETPGYLRCMKKKVYMSTDLVHWEKPSRFFNGEANETVRLSPDQSRVIMEVNWVPESE